MSINLNFRRSVFAFASIFFILINVFLYGQDADTNTASGEAELNAELVAAGETLFKNNCLVCHAVHEQKVGPALADIHNRRPVDWIKAFIRNSQKVIQSGDEYAVNLYNQYNQTLMTSFDFSDDELNSVIEYIKAETIKGPPAQEVVAAAGGEGQVVQESVLSSGVVTVFLVLLLIVLILILVVLIVLVSVLTRYLKQKAQLSEDEEEIVFAKFDFVQYVKSPAFVWIMTFVFTAIVAKTVIDGLLIVGVQEGYAPTQPIAFSHKVHAGDFQIDCNYCHTGVRTSKSANIPSVNICLNCHSSIVKVTDATELSTEIQKIYDAKTNNTPIEWVRVHNLPDLAYFNHAQHYEVGGVECQTCHGPIEEMEVVRQYSNLTMGWCIDCHKTTALNTKGNDYYDKLVEVHAETSKNPLVVEDIGGLECSKCHY
jgi:mono/diheme cytochrome c family protein